MLVQIGILFATYLGTRLYEHYKKEQTIEENQQSEANGSNLMPIPDSQAMQEMGTEADNQIKRYKHYRNASLVSLGAFGAQSFLPFLGPIGMAGYIYAAIPYMRDVEKSLFQDRKVNADVLFFTADLLALSVGLKFTAAFALWMTYFSKIKSLKAKNNSQKIIADVFDTLPQKVWILKSDVEIEIPLQDVRANDIVTVGAGEIIPVDGLISKGMVSIDQHALTGESQPVEKGVGDHVYANTVIVSGRIHIRVEKSGEDTMAAKIRQVLLHSTDFKSKIQLKGEKWADQAALPTLAIAGVTLPILGPISTAVFINSHIGGRIRLVAPIGTLKHITVAVKEGILVKNGQALEGFCDVDSILFDKTGTLTTGEPEVTQIFLCQPYQERDILSLAATAESKQSHPIAMAILKKAKESDVTWQDVHDSNYRIGYGITISLEDKTIRVGSMRFMISEGITVPKKIQQIMTDSSNNGNTFVSVAVDHQVVGAIELQPQVRPEAKTMIRQLRNQGIKHIAIVSGDHGHPTQKLAEELEVDEYFYDVLPEGKAKIVEQLQKEGKTVCFIGDGINDAIAMKQANVSISLAGATTIATDAAEVIFMDGSLIHLSTFLDISNRLNANLKTSLMLTLAPTFINIGGAFLFNFMILTSLAVNVTFTAAALGVAMLPLPPQEIKKESLSPDKWLTYQETNT